MRQQLATDSLGTSGLGLKLTLLDIHRSTHSIRGWISMSIDEPRGSQTMTLNDVGEERRGAIRECPADGGGMA
jgi:hypothetical protein